MYLSWSLYFPNLSFANFNTCSKIAGTNEIALTLNSSNNLKKSSTNFTPSVIIIAPPVYKSVYILLSAIEWLSGAVISSTSLLVFPIEPATFCAIAISFWLIISIPLDFPVVPVVNNISESSSALGSSNSSGVIGFSSSVIALNISLRLMFLIPSFFTPLSEI